MLCQDKVVVLLLQKHSKNSKQEMFEMDGELLYEVCSLRKKHPLTEPETVKEQTNVLKMGTLLTKQYWGQLLNDMRNCADLAG